MTNLQPITWKEFHSLRMSAAVAESKKKGEKLQFRVVNKEIGNEWGDIKTGKHDEFTLYAKGHAPPTKKRKGKKHNKTHKKAHDNEDNKHDKHNKNKKHYKRVRVDKSISAIEEHLLDLEKQLEECKKDLAECKKNKSDSDSEDNSFEY